MKNKDITYDRERELIDKIEQYKEELAEIQLKKENKENFPYVGRYFTYKNSYSCPENEDDFWLNYYFVKSYSNHAFNVFYFGVDSEGEISIGEKAIHYNSVFKIEISKEVFMEAWNYIKEQIRNKEIVCNLV